MNRSLKLSMLIALALGSSQAIAVDFGQVQVKSALGQPLLAEIPLHPDNPAELQGMTVDLASSEQFARAGIVGGRTAIPLRFSVASAGPGQPVIRITSSTPVNDPFLELLIEVHGKAGTSVREYAILLDPPNTPPLAAVAAAPAPSRAAQRTPAPAAATVPAQSRPAAATPAPALNNGEYGPVERGQTLSGIATKVAPSGVDVRQMMLALQQANPDAFFRDNINALKSGAVLRVPTSAEAQAMTIAAAVAEVRRQNSDWRAGVPSAPTVVADAASRASDAGTVGESTDAGDRLALVPAKQGSGAGSQGSGSGDKSVNALRQDLLRTQESLASLQQQSSDLKTRLKDLSDINGQNERLLAMKDQEIAQLQARLAAARQGGAPVGASTVAVAVPEPVTEAGTTVATATPPERTQPAAAPAATVATAAVPAGAASVGSAPEVASTPVKPASKPATEPTQPRPVNEQPWYMQTWAWAAGGGAIVLLLLLAILGRRGKSGANAPRPGSSLADRFGAPAGAGEEPFDDDVDQDELIDQLAEHPDDIDLHLELVALYYSRRDVERFEAAAEAMHAHITDPQQDEWQDVVHMGEDLAPSHPLFDQHAESSVQDGEAQGDFDIDDYHVEDDASAVGAAASPSSSEPRKVSEYNFNFDLTRREADPSSGGELSDEDVTAVSPDVADDSAPVETEASWHFDESTQGESAPGTSQDVGEFSDDPVDTKLDLARAYIDMGDAEGARAMLGEVSKEGSQVQRDTAKRLLESLN